MELADKVKQAQESFPAEEPRAIAACPPAQAIPQEEPAVIQEEEPVPVVAAKPKERPPVEEKPKTPEKTWVKIKLIDMRGKPIPGERYRIKVPGNVEPQEGVLDDEGEAACWGIDPGTCKITFPDLDEEAWEDA